VSGVAISLATSS